MDRTSETIQTLFQPYKGILAADERPSSMDKRLASYGIPEGQAMRARCREILFTTPNLERTISGIILAENTFKDHETGGVRTKDFLHSIDVTVGVKVDGGLESYRGSDTFSVTKGLDDLADRCKYYAQEGVQFLKWRSVIPVTDVPDDFLQTISKDIATYACAALASDLVPVIEPEVLLKGEHTMEETRAVLTKVITAVLGALQDQSCDPKSCVLKTSFASAGLSAKEKPPVDTVAERTLETLNSAGAEQFAGIVFLSGGLPSEDAIAYIQRVRALGEQPDTPYSCSVPITFSYARALQESMLSAWQGREENVLAAQVAFTQTLQHAVKKYKGSEEAPLGGDGKNV
ncbi:MAG: fructose-bisphosphate aldolase class I [Candidatus Kaiserbacteria bacterium]|nr:fructose-bisphosphate aldolase class I [Candidatus Kaiserbacteria bacterium]